MIVRSKSDVTSVNWGNGTSYRLLTVDDAMGFTVCHTVVSAGSQSRLQYNRHLEACYCIGGRGRVYTADGASAYDIVPGAIYALDQHDAHILEADGEEDLQLVSVFNPPLRGDETHRLDRNGFSQY